MSLLIPTYANNYGVVKMDQNGVYEWSFFFSASTSFYINSLAVSSDQKLLVVGTFVGTVDLDPGIGESWFTSSGFADFFLLSFDLEGNLLNAVVLAGPGYAGTSKIYPDKNGLFYLECRSYSSMNLDPQTNEQLGIFEQGNHFIAKYTSNFELVWVKEIGYSNFSNLRFLDCVSDEEGNTYWVGHYAGDISLDSGSGTIDLSVPIIYIDDNGFSPTQAFIIKLNSEGELIWTKVSGLNWGVSIYNAELLNNETLVLSGFTNDDIELTDNSILPIGFGNYFMAIVETSTSDIINAVLFNDGFLDFKVANGKIWTIGILGTTNGEDIDPQETVFSLYSTNSNDSYITSYDFDFNLININQLGGSSSQISRYLLPAAESEVWVFGEFSSELISVNSPGDVNIGSSQLSDLFMLEITSCEMPFNVETIEGPTNLCSNTAYNFTLQNNQSDITYLWQIEQIGDGDYAIADLGDSLQLTMLGADTIDISIRLLNSCGISSATGIQVIGSDYPELTLFSNVMSPVCENTEVILSAETDENSTLQTDGNFEIGIPFNLLGSQSFEVSATSDFGCTSIASLALDVVPLPIAELQVQPSSELCFGNDVVVSYIENANFSYSSNFVNGESTFFNEDTIVELEVTDENGCVGFTNELITIYPLPNITEQPISTTINENGDFQFNVFCSNLDVEYEWQVQNSIGWQTLFNVIGYSGSNTSQLSFTNTPLTMDGKIYRCQLTLGDCLILSDEVILHVDPVTENVVSYDGATIELWPNPTIDYLKIQVPPFALSTSLGIYNTLGEVVKSVVLISETTSINVEDLPPGAYCIKVQTLPQISLKFCKN